MRTAYICATVLSSVLAFLAGYFWLRSARTEIPNQTLTVDATVAIPLPTMAALRASAKWSQRGAWATCGAAIMTGTAGLLSLGL